MSEDIREAVNPEGEWPAVDDDTWKSWRDSDGNITAAVKGERGRVRIVATYASLEPDDALDFADAIAEAAAIQGAMLGSMGPDNKGGWTVQAQPSPGLMRRMVAFLCEWLGPAENYTETPVGLPFDLPAGGDSMEMRPKPAGQVQPYVLTVQRAGGKTPHEKRLEAEAERDALRDAIHSLIGEEFYRRVHDGRPDGWEAHLTDDEMARWSRIAGVET